MKGTRLPIRPAHNRRMASIQASQQAEDRSPVLSADKGQATSRRRLIGAGMAMGMTIFGCPCCADLAVGKASASAQPWGYGKLVCCFVPDALLNVCPAPCPLCSLTDDEDSLTVKTCAYLSTNGYHALSFLFPMTETVVEVTGPTTWRGSCAIGDRQVPSSTLAFKALCV